MTHVETIEELPPNFHEFVDEIAAGLADIYGPAAASSYLDTGPIAIAASLLHPHVTGCIIAGDSGAQAMLMSIVRTGLAHISFIHVLRPYEGRGLESQLIEWAVAHFRAAGVSGIVVETVPLCSLDLDATCTRLGFQRIERMLMLAPLSATSLAASNLRSSTPLDEDEWEDAATVILDAYRGHPGQLLHAEVRSKDGALAFIANAVAGGFGRTRPGFIRGIQRDGRLAAAVFGCEAAPNVGFILQIAVRPEFSRKGLGTALLCDAAQCFRDASYTRLALGVTADNPARRLYERLGFRRHRSVTAYAWWR